MITLNLSEEQATSLRVALDRFISDLSMEIADTDTKDYRDFLKARRDHLRELADQLPDAKS